MMARQLPFLKFSRQSLVPVVILNFVAYVNVGLPMAVIPLFMVETLHFNTIMAGFAVSVQYLATFISRPAAGLRIDARGPRPIISLGLIMCAASGVFLLLTGLFSGMPYLALTLLLASRCALGWGESWTTTAAIIWNIRRVGPNRIAQAISWNGVTSYGGMAFGATLGSQFYNLHGLFGGVVLLGLISIPAPMIAAYYAQGIPRVFPLPAVESPMPYKQVFKHVYGYGCILASGSIGFGAMSSCLALFYASYQWTGASSAIAAFGATYISVRFVFANFISRVGGAKVAVVSLVIEALGLFIVAIAHGPGAAFLGAAVIGAGFSLVFPALGVLAVESAGAENRGAALGAYSVFSDLAIGLSGPLLGLLIHLVGYHALFIVTALVTVSGALTLTRMQRVARR